VTRSTLLSEAGQAWVLPLKAVEDEQDARRQMIQRCAPRRCSLSLARPRTARNDGFCLWLCGRDAAGVSHVPVGAFKMTTSRSATKKQPGCKVASASGLSISSMMRVKGSGPPCWRMRIIGVERGLIPVREGKEATNQTIGWDCVEGGMNEGDKAVRAESIHSLPTIIFRKMEILI
jgi:hypothetical protein